MNFLDDVAQGMINVLPEAWRPYVMLAFLLLYVGTKVNKYLTDKKASDLAKEIGVKEYPSERSWPRAVVDFIF